MREAEGGQAAARGPLLAIAVASLATGAALLAYIASGISLAVTALSAGAIAVAVTRSAWQRASPAGRASMRRAAYAGVLSGVAATAAYDVSRFLLIEITGIAFWPFDIFAVFGRALVGATATGCWVEALGLGYHVANGIGFALSYTLLLGRRGVWAGIGWALALEVLMVSVYPGWLGLQALDEFLQVSIFGHLIYGAVLGYTARALLTRGDA